MRDEKAYFALWRAVCDAADKLASRCQISYLQRPGVKIRVRPGLGPPEVESWQLVEALSLLMVISNADAVFVPEVGNLFGRNMRLHILEDTMDRYVWTQVPVKGGDSDLGSRPDIIITDSPSDPSSKAIKRVIECKFCRRLGAPIVRAEFGKAFDLKPASYLIWSYIMPSPNVILGAKKLGIDIVGLGFDTTMRAELLASPENLQKHISSALQDSRREANFAKAIIRAGEDMSPKLLLMK